ncbi:alkaline phosphatase family protein [Brevibacillus choshinensis]|uniref:Alkaline phosphatase family protein n=1 Tax=Brevibacillus choshinensis TaxID=54911 RepID=A0ABX7FI63_BRECH|nr:alkaline phosphatase family protein [Brevibacillus choshinensis]QRG65908.1 alkaline phosphatase family protein [Brevibacillus choshinensis]
MKSNKVIVVVVDGMQYQAAITQMGFVNHLVEVGKAARYLVKSELPSLSRPLYEVLLTGTPSSVNGITSNHTVRLSGQKSIFHLTKEHGRINAAAAYYWVSELYNRAPFHYVEDRFQNDVEKPIQHGRFYFDDNYPDSHLIIDGETLRREFDPDFLYIHSMGVDNAGHLYGSDSKQYRGSVIAVDTILAQMLPIWMEEGYQIIVTSDHGMNPDGNHGGTGDDERNVPMYGIGSAFAPGVYEEAVPQLAVAPLICRLLGIPASEAMIPHTFPGVKI